MQVTVYGATGTFGARLVTRLRAMGHSVIAAHRGIGVDTCTGEGVTEAAVGSDVLVDCVNLLTNNRHRALDFFSRSARSIALAAAENPGAAMVCLSIAFKPAVAGSALFGYYQGKNMQERVYRRLVPADQLLMFRSTQWYELAATASVSVGPVVFAPKMRVRALAADEAARMMAEAIEAGERGTVEVAGPEISDLAAIARVVAEAEAGRTGERTQGSGVRRRGRTRARKVVPVPIPGPTADDGLIPESPRLSTVTVDEWLRTR